MKEKLWHITDDGEAKRCEAFFKKCKYGSFEHFKNSADAIKAAELRMEKEYSVVNSLKKTGNSQKKAPFNNTPRLKYNNTNAAGLDANVEDLLTRKDMLSKTVNYHIEEIVNDKRVMTKTLMKVAAANALKNGNIIKNTGNKRLVQLAYLNKDHEVRKAALENPLTTDRDLYAMTLHYNEKAYKKDHVKRLENAGYDTSHIKQHGQKTPAQPNLEAERIKTKVQEFGKKFDNYKKLRMESVPEALSMLEHNTAPEYKEYIRLLVDDLRNTDRVENFKVTK